MKFKVGDYVRCIDNKSLTINNITMDNITMGYIYKVIDIDSSMVKIVNDSNLEDWYFNYRFKLDIRTERKNKLKNINKEEFSAGDIVAYKRYNYQDASLGRDTTPPFFEIIKVDDLSRVWYGDDCIGIAYIRHATNFEIEWYKRITNPRKTILNLNKNNI